MTMRKLLITDPARSDIREIRSYTRGQYGGPAADAYDTLLKQALRDLRDDPFRPGSKERPEIGANIRSYHTALSRERAASGVKAPRHFIVYFLPRDDELVISRILHDARDLARHLPGDHLDEARNIIRKRGGEKRGRKR